VITAAAARFGWTGYKKEDGRGRGFAFARYKNLAAYMALAVEIELDRESGRVRLKRAVAAVDSGEAVKDRPGAIPPVPSPPGHGRPDRGRSGPAQNSPVPDRSPAS
jgi:hypothetical protein